MGAAQGFFQVALRFVTGWSQPQKTSRNVSRLHVSVVSNAEIFQMRKAILLVCIYLFGCASAHHWEKADSAGKIESTQDAEALRKTLTDCLANASGKGQDLDTMFGSKSAQAVFEKCMHDKGYTQS